MSSKKIIKSEKRKKTYSNVPVYCEVVQSSENSLPFSGLTISAEILVYHNMSK